MFLFYIYKQVFWRIVWIIHYRKKPKQMDTKPVLIYKGNTGTPFHNFQPWRLFFRLCRIYELEIVISWLAELKR